MKILVIHISKFIQTHHVLSISLYIRFRGKFEILIIFSPVFLIDIHFCSAVVFIATTSAALY